MKSLRLSPFFITVLELCQHAANCNEAVTYVADWQGCSRAKAMQHITDAKLAEKQLNAALESERMATGHA